MIKEMTSEQLIEKGYLALNSDTWYVKGCIGAPLDYDLERWTEASRYSYNRLNAKSIRKHAEDAVKAGTHCFGGDCICFWKAIFWGWNADGTKEYGGCTYQKDGILDETINYYRTNYCEDVSTDFSNILPGEALFLDKDGSHFGVYVGDGYAIEITPKWTGNMQKTQVWNINKTEDKGRKWWAHGKLKFIDYKQPKYKKIICPCCGKEIGTFLEV